MEMDNGLPILLIDGANRSLVAGLAKRAVMTGGALIKLFSVLPFWIAIVT